MPAALFLPLLVCTRSVAACKAAQAVRGSSVKLEGRDVLSTWKIMVSPYLPISPHISPYLSTWKIMVSLVTKTLALTRTRTRTRTLTLTLTLTLALTLTSTWSVR